MAVPVSDYFQTLLSNSSYEEKKVPLQRLVELELRVFNETSLANGYPIIPIYEKNRGIFKTIYSECVDDDDKYVGFKIDSELLQLDDIQTKLLNQPILYSSELLEFAGHWTLFLLSEEKLEELKAVSSPCFQEYIRITRDTRLVMQTRFLTEKIATKEGSIKPPKVRTFRTLLRKKLLLQDKKNGIKIKGIKNHIDTIDSLLVPKSEPAILNLLEREYSYLTKNSEDFQSIAYLEKLSFDRLKSELQGLGLEKLVGIKLKTASLLKSLAPLVEPYTHAASLNPLLSQEDFSIFKNVQGRYEADQNNLDKTVRQVYLPFSPNLGFGLNGNVIQTMQHWYLLFKGCLLLMWEFGPTF